MGRVEGKVSIVTGAAMGIGEAIANLLAREGSTVIISDINEEKGQTLAKKLGTQATFIRHDVSEENQWISAIEQTLSKFGRLDVLVNNAGIVSVADVEQTTLEDWHKVHAVHMDGTFLGCKHAIPAMRKSGGGSIVNISSLSAIGGYPLVFAYTASKGAIRSMTKSIAVHCSQSQYNIRCNSVHPGMIETPLIKEFFSSAPKYQDALLGKPDDVAYMVLYLASDESKFVSGSEFIIDYTASVAIADSIVPKQKKVD